MTGREAASTGETASGAGGVLPRRLSVVLPAYNEESNVGTALEHACKVGERLCDDYEVIVVDDGSADATARIVEEVAATNPHVRLVRHARNRGYGEALRSGFLAARMDLVFFTDADNQFELDELEGFLGWIDRVDVVVGYRIKRQDPFVRRVMAAGWNSLVRVLFYVPVRDIDCAFKLFRRPVLQDLEIESVGAMVNTELMVKLGRSGVSLVELGVTHRPRTAGRARGANPKVIGEAFLELGRMYRRLHRAGVGHARDPELRT